MEFVFNDGGREAAGWKPSNDCTLRAFAIATGMDYRKARSLFLMASPSDEDCGRGFSRKTLTRVMGLLPHPWIWTPTMGIGTGCTVHLKADELPSGRLIVSLSRHMAAVINGVLHDTYDCSRDGTRCVYGYWQQP